ncbi:MAG: hypothetical protein MZW92_49160 [Comamonadaceae bacterium]|nr:hypothetical protein [Comamonadaceae bacterium]
MPVLLEHLFDDRWYVVRNAVVDPRRDPQSGYSAAPDAAARAPGDPRAAGDNQGPD